MNLELSIVSWRGSRAALIKLRWAILTVGTPSTSEVYSKPAVCVGKAYECIGEVNT